MMHREVPINTRRLRKAESRPPPARRRRGSYPRLADGAGGARVGFLFPKAARSRRNKDENGRGSRRARGLVRDRAHDLETGDPAKEDTR